MAEVRVQIIGASDVSEWLRSIPLRGQSVAKEVVRKYGFLIQRGAKTFCPVDTGRLRSSIALRYYNNGLTADVGTNVEYASHVEFGTRYQRAQPFLGTAYEVLKGDFERELASEIDKATK